MKSRLPVRWSRRALADLEKILAHVARDNPQAAHGLRVAAVEGLEHARDFPEACRVVPELRNPAIREVLQEPLRLVYQILPEELRVLMVRRMEQAPIASPPGKA